MLEEESLEITEAVSISVRCGALAGAEERWDASKVSTDPIAFAGFTGKSETVSSCEDLRDTDGRFESLGDDGDMDKVAGFVGGGGLVGFVVRIVDGFDGDDCANGDLGFVSTGDRRGTVREAPAGGSSLECSARSEDSGVELACLGVLKSGLGLGFKAPALVTRSDDCFKSFGWEDTSGAADEPVLMCNDGCPVDCSPLDGAKPTGFKDASVFPVGARLFGPFARDFVICSSCLGDS